MTYLLDTNAVSDLINNDPRLTARLAGIKVGERIVVCPVVRGEILYGVERLPVGKRREELTRNAHEVLRTFFCESMHVSVGDLYANLKQSSQSVGASISENDPWIAATAMSLDATVITRDADFTRIPGLKVENWTA